MVNLKAKPFFLTDEQIRWVEETRNSMTLEEKIGQLFCPVGFTTDRGFLKMMLDKGIGGMMYRPGPAAETQETHRFLQENSKIPLFLAANLEAGGNGVTVDGTSFGKPMQAAATGDPEEGYHLGKISCTEGAAVGVNWSFAPIIDIDNNWRNPITNLRTFGSDPETVLKFGEGYLRGAKEAGLIVSIKHFPGDGCDERDQHLHVTINDKSADEWMATYGKIYKTLIDQGAETVMVGHIAQPAWAKKLDPTLSDEEAYLPATLSPVLLKGLLRGELGFNGLISTDATPMLGFMCAMPRKKAVPTAIENGCDMFLFNKDFEEDYNYMLEGFREGLLSEERLDEALTRILGTKAAMHLPEKKAAGTLVPGPEALSVLRNPQFLKWTEDCADKAVTLVKDTQKLLPVTPEKYPRVVIFASESGGFMGETDELYKQLRAELERRGFTVLDTPGGGGFTDKPINVEEFKSKYDLAIFAFNFTTASNNTVVRLSWKGALTGAGAPWFTQELPTMAISFANPYHLIDTPQIRTFINSYTLNEFTLKATVDKMLGLSEFKGTSPVDPFCGRFDTRL